MRVKTIVNSLPFKEKIKLVYERITQTPCTKSYFFLALVHCISQVILQSITFSWNKSAGNTIHSVFNAAGMQPTFAFVQNDVLMVCEGIPLQGTSSPCWPIAGPGVQINTTNSTLASRSFAETGLFISKRHDGTFLGDVETEADSKSKSGKSKSKHDDDDDDDDSDDIAQNMNDDLTGKLTTVNASEFLNGVDTETDTALSTRCVRSLSWPEITLHDAKREDFVFLAFQIWLLGISIVTILNESIPHLVSALFTHALASGWSAFSVHRTQYFNNLYRSLVVEDACDGVDLLPDFWANRLKVQIPLLVLNFVVLACVVAVSFSLYKVFARRTFKRVGASQKMNQLYKLVLIFSASLQMSAFFTIASSALWIDTICTSVIAQYANHKVAYRVVFIVTCIIELPWLVTGWTAIRREKRILILVFFTLGLLILAAWSSMFASVLYRWTFQNFPFFATMSITAFVFLVSTLALAVACRMNFGKGLPQYLKNEDTFDFSSFVPVFLPRRSKDGRSSIRPVSVIFPDRPPRHHDSVDEKYADLSKIEDGKGAIIIDIKGDSIAIPQLGSQLSSAPDERPSIHPLQPPPRAVPRPTIRSSFTRVRNSLLTMLTTSTYTPQTPAAPPQDGASRFQVPEINVIPSSYRKSAQVAGDDSASFRTFGSQDGRDTPSGRGGRGSLGRSIGLPSNPRANRI